MTSIELDLTFLVPNYGAKLHQNQVKIATVGGWLGGSVNRQTDVTDAEKWPTKSTAYNVIYCDVA